MHQAQLDVDIETERRQIRDDVTRARHDVIALEVTLGIKAENRWTPSHPKYRETMKFVREKKYFDALEHLQRLVILRLFELHKLNISQTGKTFSI